MTAKQSTMRKIRKVMSSAKDAFTLGDLFAPTGLFSHLAKTEAERAKLVRSPLFKEAQKRFHELQEEEATELFGKMQQRYRSVEVGNGRSKRKIG